MSAPCDSEAYGHIQPTTAISNRRKKLYGCHSRIWNLFLLLSTESQFQHILKWKIYLPTESEDENKLNPSEGKRDKKYCFSVFSLLKIFQKCYGLLLISVLLSSPHEAQAFDEIRRYHTRPLRTNWGPENVHFGKMQFLDLSFNA